MSLRIIFFGTPEFAVPPLRDLLASGDRVVGVVCQPDRPAGRGQKLSAPPVKEAALAAGVPVLQPEKVRTEEFLSQLRAWTPDIIIVVAYGRILPKPILELPRLGCINVHASLLPKYRGAAPIQWAIYRGETHTGVTIMRINERMDAGDMLLQRETGIGESETYGELQTRLSELGAAALLEALPRIADGSIEATVQVEEEATHAPMVKKEDGRIDWQKPAVEIARMVRAFNPWPSAYTFVAGKRLQIHRAHVAESSAVGSAAAAIAGQVHSVGEGIAIGTGNGLLIADELQIEGKRRLPAGEISRSGQLSVGAQLG